MADQRLEAMPGGAVTPVRNAARQGIADAHCCLGFPKPGQATITRQTSTIEGRLQRQAGSRMKSVGSVSRMNHRSTAWVEVLDTLSIQTVLRYDL